MEAVTYSKFRQNLRSLMRQINDDAERLVVTTNDNTDVVVLSKEDYDSWQETFYLMQSKLNRTRLDEAINDVENSLSDLKEFDFDEENE
ncbi:type II toxin-antitoxin system Phd/YefM family antitoxin [Enterococcus mundtii]|uniref:type II toxin-antitoxin system Phd/YefM family antitoxin n=1 Tax=Enterococcus mundtii TaxID=53346 RepID=UPI0013786A5E|nr:type II toxin-antitoxin system Phd/YefM family antitoxin [Enterococcus mundtii]NBA63567.1 type II toxin-antitoxin system prevent-host-death family antitoxin [Enterococcus mundtii]